MTIPYDKQKMLHHYSESLNDELRYMTQKHCIGPVQVLFQTNLGENWPHTTGVRVFPH